MWLLHLMHTKRKGSLWSCFREQILLQPGPNVGSDLRPIIVKISKSPILSEDSWLVKNFPVVWHSGVLGHAPLPMSMYSPVLARAQGRLPYAHKLGGCLHVHPHVAEEKSCATRSTCIKNKIFQMALSFPSPLSSFQTTHHNFYPKLYSICWVKHNLLSLLIKFIFSPYSFPSPHSSFTLFPNFRSFFRTKILQSTSAKQQEGQANHTLLDHQQHPAIKVDTHNHSFTPKRYKPLQVGDTTHLLHGWIRSEKFSLICFAHILEGKYLKKSRKKKCILWNISLA